MTRVQPIVVERRGEIDRTAHFGAAMPTPSIDENYWAYRVRLTERQAVLGFPKFSTIGIGFAVEEDWNANLPYTCNAPEIADHILHNKGDGAITRDDVVDAIQAIKQAITADALKTAAAI